MSDLWLNIRILMFHLQVKRGHLFRFRLVFNRAHLRWRTLIAPAAIYELNVAAGWLSWLVQAWRRAKAYDSRVYETALHDGMQQAREAAGLPDEMMRAANFRAMTQRMIDNTPEITDGSWSTSRDDQQIQVQTYEEVLARHRALMKSLEGK